MIFYNSKAVKLAEKTSHDKLVLMYQQYEEKLKMLLYAGSIKELKKLKKEHSIVQQAMLYQYTPKYTRYLNKIQRK